MQLRIDVCDTGAGIPEDQRQTIFTEFYQLANPAPGRNAGLGLGLAIVDRLGRLGSGGPGHDPGVARAAG